MHQINLNVDRHMGNRLTDTHTSLDRGIYTQKYITSRLVGAACKRLGIGHTACIYPDRQIKTLKVKSVREAVLLMCVCVYTLR